MPPNDRKGWADNLFIINRRPFAKIYLFHRQRYLFSSFTKLNIGNICKDLSFSLSEMFVFFFHKVEYWTCSSSYFCQFLCLIFLSQQVFTKRMPTVCGERYRSKKFSKQFVLPVLYIRSGPSVSSFCGISSFRNVCGEFSVKAVVSPCHINF